MTILDNLLHFQKVIRLKVQVLCNLAHGIRVILHMTEKTTQLLNRLASAKHALFNLLLSSFNPLHAVSQLAYNPVDLPLL